MKLAKRRIHALFISVILPIIGILGCDTQTPGSLTFDSTHEDAERGDRFAQYLVGRRYQIGSQGYPKDTKKAIHWNRLSAEQGYEMAMVSLGEIYQFDNGAHKNTHEAIKWYRVAAEYGSDDGQFNLGRLYDEGDGVQEDNVKAVYWYKKAAKNGQGNAPSRLARMYAIGEGVSVNLVEAYAWYSVKGLYPSQKIKMERIKQQLTPEQLATAERRANKYRKEHDANKYAKYEKLHLRGIRQRAFRGNAEDQFDLGKKYRDGEGVLESIVYAYAWMNLSAASFESGARDSRDRLKHEMTPEQIAEGQRLSVELQEKIDANIAAKAKQQDGLELQY